VGLAASLASELGPENVAWVSDQDRRNLACELEPRIVELKYSRGLRNIRNWADIIVVPHQLGPSQLREIRATSPTPVLVNWLDFISLRRVDYFSSSLARARAFAGAAWVLDNVDGIVWLSEFVRNQARDFGFGQGIPQAVIGTGLGAHLEPGIPELSEQRTRPFLLHVAGAFPHKRRDLGLFALRLLLDQGFDVDLVNVGATAFTGNTAKADIDLSRRLSLDSHVHNLEHVEPHAMAALFSEAAVVLCLSDEEGFGMTPMEAAKYGTPCVFTSGGSLGEILPAALGVPPYPSEVANRIGRLLEDPKDAAMNVKRILEASSPFNWAAVSRRFLEFVPAVALRHVPQSSTVRSFAPKFVHSFASRASWAFKN
jgi:Glycosyl transferases group 1